MLKGGETEIPISSYNNLRVKIFLIGYKNQGESIVILFIDVKQRDVKYSIVIDSYKTKEKNITDEILRSYSVRCLSLLCWTHPDIDHSLGMDFLIKKYCKDTTKVLLPDYFYNESSDIVSINDRDLKDAVDRIFCLNRLKKRHVTTINVPANNFIQVDNMKFVGIDGLSHISINAVTPISSILAQYVKSCKHNVEKNELSISMIIDIDDYYIYLGGDAVNRHIDSINSGYLEQCRFIKIPHHASNTSRNLLSYLSDNVDTACTTIFSSKDLPRDEILLEYSSLCRVFSTGAKNSKQYDFGVVEYEYDFSKEDIDMQVRLFGNAMEIL